MKEYPAYFSEEDIGKIFTIRSWEDMENEFPRENEWDSISGPNDAFTTFMKFLCGKKVICISEHDIKEDGGHNYYPWMTVEYRDRVQHGKSWKSQTKCIPSMYLYHAFKHPYIGRVNK